MTTPQETANIVDRLRTLSERPLTGSWYYSEFKEAADAIEALTKANAEMREALEDAEKAIDDCLHYRSHHGHKALTRVRTALATPSPRERE